jgi:thermostable 8-oxoguanine DNA glycosylase
MREYHDVELDITSLEKLENLMVFCILDRAMPYEKVCKAYDTLREHGLDTKQGLSSVSKERIAELLSSSGFRFPNQTANFLKGFSGNAIDLRNASRTELCSIKGIGMKLASMFLNRTRGTQYAIIDIHIKRWLDERGLLSKNYLTSERNFIREAEKLGMTPDQLDYQIWNTNRRK